MAQKNKTNPRKIPRSQADVDKAFENGASLMLDLIVFTLGTDMEMPDEWLEQFHERYMAHLKALTDGYISREDLRNTTYQERGWEVNLI